MASKKAGLGNSPRGKTAAGNIILRPPHRIDLVTREFIMRYETGCKFGRRCCAPGCCGFPKGGGAKDREVAFHIFILACNA